MNALFSSGAVLAAAAAVAILYLAAGALMVRTELLVAVGVAAARLAASAQADTLRAVARY